MPNSNIESTATENLGMQAKPLKKKSCTVYLHQSWLQQVVLVIPSFSQALILYRNIKINTLGNKRYWGVEKGYKTFQLTVSKRDSRLLSSFCKFILFEGSAWRDGDMGQKFCTLTKDKRKDHALQWFATPYM